MPVKRSSVPPFRPAALRRKRSPSPEDTEDDYVPDISEDERLVQKQRRSSRRKPAKNLPFEEEVPVRPSTSKQSKNKKRKVAPNIKLPDNLSENQSTTAGTNLVGDAIDHNYVNTQKHNDLE